MSEHWCPIHKTPFFKKGNMKGYAHPIKDAEGNTTGWCNEDQLPSNPDHIVKKGEPVAEKFEPAINQQKQNSIEIQNAVNNIVALWVGGKLDEMKGAGRLKMAVKLYLEEKVYRWIAAEGDDGQA